MVDRTYAVGDVVAWDEVQDGWLVLGANGTLAARRQANGLIVGRGGSQGIIAEHWGESSDIVTIIAAGLTGKETADDLQRLAEVYDIDQCIEAHRLPARVRLNGETLIVERWLYDLAGHAGDDGWCRVIAEHLHRVGWRRGDGAVKARELLAAEGRR
jgi:hypothetical protein